jgi:hypothetical protein
MDGGHDTVSAVVYGSSLVQILRPQALQGAPTFAASLTAGLLQFCGVPLR